MTWNGLSVDVANMFSCLSVPDIWDEWHFSGYAGHQTGKPGRRPQYTDEQRRKLNSARVCAFQKAKRLSRKCVCGSALKRWAKMCAACANDRERSRAKMKWQKTKGAA